MHDDMLQTHQLEFVFMMVIPDYHPFPFFIKKGTQPVMHPLTMRLQDELSNENIMCKGIFQFKSQFS